MGGLVGEERGICDLSKEVVEFLVPDVLKDLFTGDGEGCGAALVWVDPPWAGWAAAVPEGAEAGACLDVDPSVDFFAVHCAS